MYFNLTSEEVKFLKRQLPTIRLNGYDIDKFQSIMKSLDNPTRAIPTLSENSKDEITVSKKHVKHDDFYGGIRQKEVNQNEKEILVDDPITYDGDDDVLQNNSFLKPPKIEKVIKKNPPNINKDSQPSYFKKDFTPNYKEQLDELENKSEDIDELEEESSDLNIQEESNQEIKTIEQEKQIQTEPDDSIFKNQSTDVESASIFSVVDSRTKKE